MTAPGAVYRASPRGGAEPARSANVVPFVAHGGPALGSVRFEQRLH